MSRYSEEPSDVTAKLPTKVVYGLGLSLFVAVLAAVLYLVSIQPDAQIEAIDIIPSPSISNHAIETNEVVNSEPYDDILETPNDIEPVEEVKDVAAAETVSLPPLNNSDDTVREVIESITAGLTDLLVPDELIRKFVLAVNTTSRGELSRKYPPILPPQKSFVATQITAESFNMSQESYRRYDPYIRLLSALDMQDVAVLYRQYYPLLEEAHQELGQTKKNFHATLVMAIDNLLMAPEREGKLSLIRTSVLYKYADTALEKLPASHKLLLRMGPENTREFKKVLETLKAAIAR